MRLQIPLTAYAGLFFLFTPLWLGGQALQDRDHPEQASALRAAVLAGELPPADTWPQAAPVPAGPRQAGPSAASEGRFRADLGLWLGGDPLWLDEAGPFYRQDPLLRWSVHSEETGKWGMLLHADFTDQNPGWNLTNLVLPREGNAFPLENHFLTRGWLWYDFDPLQVQIGRDKVHWGPLDHSLLISDTVPFLDMVRTSLHSGPWGLDWILSTPETRRGGGGTAVEKTVLINLHRLEFHTSRWRLAASELYIVSRGPTGPFTLADLFPVMVEHQADMNPNNNCLVFDAEWVPGPGLRIMGQVGFDDINATFFGMPDEEIPTIWAYQLGAEWQGFWGRGQARVHAEMGYTHYLWGNFGDPDAKAEYLLVQYGRTEAMPLSSPYGPGTAWTNLSVQWTRGPLSLGAEFALFSTKAGVSPDIPYRKNSAFDGLGRQMDDRFSLTARLNLGPDWRLVFEPSREYRRGEAGFEVRFGIEGSWSTQGLPVW